MSKAMFAAFLAKRRMRLGLLLVAALAMTAIGAISFVGPARPAGGGGDPAVPNAVSVTVTFAEQDEATFLARSYEFTGLADRAAEHPGNRNGNGKGNGNRKDERRHDYSPFNVRKPLDALNSPKLARAFAEDEALPTVQVDVLGIAGTVLLSYTLEDAWIAAYRHQTPDFPGQIIEDIGFGFETITYEIGGSPIIDTADDIFQSRERNDNPTGG